MQAWGLGMAGAAGRTAPLEALEQAALQHEAHVREVGGPLRKACAQAGEFAFA